MSISENIILTAKNETKKALNEAERDIRKTAGAMDKDLAKGADTASRRIGELGRGLNATVQQLTGFNLAQIGVAGGLAMVAKGIGDSIQFTARYAEQVRELSAATGMGAEETSKMIQLFDDANVSQGLLTQAARQLVRNGLQPSIDTIAMLADQYNALTDPVERSKLLLDNFGRAGLEMGKLLEMGSEKIRDAGESAERMGQVLDEEAIAAAEEYRLALDELSDAAEGVKIKIGMGLIPVLADMVTYINNGIGSMQERIDKVHLLDEALAMGVISQQEYNEMVITTSRGMKLLVDTNIELEGIEAAMRDDRQESIELLRAQKLAQEELSGATEGATNVYRQAIAALQEHTLTEAQRLSIETQIKLLSGELTKEDLRRSQMVQLLSNQYAQGNLTMQQYLDALQSLGAGLEADAAKALELARNIEKIKSKTVTVTVNYKNTYATEGGIRPGAGRAAGGPVTAKLAYLVGEKGPELFVPQTSGMIVPSNEIAASRTPIAAGAVYIGNLNIFAGEGMDEFDLADAVVTRLAEQQRAAEKAGVDFAG